MYSALIGTVFVSAVSLLSKRIKTSFIRPLFLEHRNRMVGPIIKLLIAATVIFILWLIIYISRGAFAGLVYRFVTPIMAMFNAVRKGKEKPFVHSFVVHFI